MVITDKFCTSCDAILNEGTVLCTECGANASSVSEKAVVQPGPATPKRETILSKAGKKVKSQAKEKAAEYGKNIISDAFPASQSAGELSLPSELLPLTGNLAGAGLLSLLKDGFKSLVGGFQRTLGDKKRRLMVIVLAAVWLVVNLLDALDISPFPLRVLSWLTAARGSLIGGSVAKGLLASLLAQLIVDKGTLQKLKTGIGKLTGVVKGGKKDYAPLLLGAGAGLFVCNLMVSSNWHNSMVCVAGFALSAKALAQNGFLRRLTASLFSKASNGTLTAVMGGWTLGFALFAAVSFLPGGQNGTRLGIILMATGLILPMIHKGRKGATA